MLTCLEVFIKLLLIPTSKCNSERSLEYKCLLKLILQKKKREKEEKGVKQSVVVYGHVPFVVIVVPSGN